MTATDPQPSVLVVEADPSIAETCEASLSDRYEVHVSDTAEAALAALSARRFDAIVLDRVLPDEPGEDVLSAIRDRGIDTPVGMLWDSDTPDHGAEAELDGSLVKPVSADGIEVLVERLLTTESVDSLERELSDLRVERSVLEVESPQSELADSDRYQAILDRISTLEAEKRRQLANQAGGVSSPA